MCSFRFEIVNRAKVICRIVNCQDCTIRVCKAVFVIQIVYIFISFFPTYIFILQNKGNMHCPFIKCFLLHEIIGKLSVLRSFDHR